MSGLGFWLLGSVMGLRHGVDPDHLTNISAIFSIGSVVGMAGAAFVLSFPVWVTQRRFERAYWAVLAMAITVSAVFGAYLL